MTTDTVVRPLAGTLLGAFTDGGTSNPPPGNEDAAPCCFTELPIPLTLAAAAAAEGEDEAAVTSSEKSPRDVVVVVVVVGEGGGKASERE